MSRWVPLLVGLAVLLGTGIVHGLWTDRWRPSQELAEAAARLEGLPDEIGTWKGEVYEQDPEELKLTGAAGQWCRTFTDARTGEKVLVLLLCGKPAQMSVHRPEHCYRAVGYEQAAAPVHVQIRSPGKTPAEFWTGVFSRDESAGPSQLRIFWSWCAGDRWSAPDSPRLAFARQGFLYKLYVIRSVTESGTLADDPGVKFLEQLLLILDEALRSS
jgi:hypothetical protein